MKKYIRIISLFLLVSLLTACGDNTANKPEDELEAELLQNSSSAAESSREDASLGEQGAAQTTPPSDRPRPETLEEQMENTINATITMEDGGVITLELYPDVAPESVRNFVYLARDGYYDGLKFHRIIKGFMVQGGCPLGTGTGNPGYSIAGEFAANGFQNDLKHDRGVLSMARSGDPNSAGSQFFIMHENSPHLDGSYAAFGAVTSGIEVVDSMTDIPVIDNNGSVAPDNMPVIRSIVIDDDIELPEPSKIQR